jgi:hypothetical protein
MLCSLPVEKLLPTQVSPKVIGIAGPLLPRSSSEVAA